MHLFAATCPTRSIVTADEGSACGHVKPVLTTRRLSADG